MLEGPAGGEGTVGDEGAAAAVGCPMIAWLATLDRLARAGTPAVLVTVVEARGSTPREAGAKLVVTREDAFGTIGGGNLEFQAIRQARSLLAGGSGAGALRRFALGPSLGQCCGGDARLLLEPLRQGGGRPRWLDAGLRLAATDEAAVLVTAVGPEPAKALVDATGVVVGEGGEDFLDPATVATARAMLRDRAGPRLDEVDGRGYLFEPLRPPAHRVVLFGAGHVGKALVHVLGALPCRVSWIDGRAEQFPAEVPPNVTVEVSAAPEHVVARVPAGAAFLVMTHSHALDLQLVEAILGRGDFGYLGLIGSRTKRARFEKRLRARGFSEADLGRLICPIGIPEVRGKHPGEIAVAVAAQLLATFAGRQAESAAAATLESATS